MAPARAGCSQSKTCRLRRAHPRKSGSIRTVFDGRGGCRHQGVVTRTRLERFSDFSSITAAPFPERATDPDHNLDPEVSDLLADLLGATLVDAQDELRAAWSVLDRQGRPGDSALEWMTEPPPWPPASVEKLQSRGGDRALAMVHDLAGQIAPDPELRFWLIQSWLRPRRLIDGSLLNELRTRGRAAWSASPGSAPGCAGNGQPGLGNGIVGSPGLPPARFPRGPGKRPASPALSMDLQRPGAGRSMIRVIIEGLVKRYGQVAAVDGASLEIGPGELACLLGPPGAGKTTLGRLLAGLERRTTARSTSTTGSSSPCRLTSAESAWSFPISPSGPA